jgi:hypothetical protein
MLPEVRAAREYGALISSQSAEVRRTFSATEEARRATETITQRMRRKGLL